MSQTKPITNREATNRAVESLRTEGFIPDKEDLARFERLATNEVNTERARKELLADIEQKRKISPELFKVE